MTAMLGGELDLATWGLRAVGVAVIAAVAYYALIVAVAFGKQFPGVAQGPATAAVVGVLGVAVYGSVSKVWQLTT